MATVEQCETQSSGLPGISKTLYDDTFKPSQEEEKDSDEESFHLPMLDCDDDLDSNTKEVLISDTGKDLHNGETEDEILNKFETNGTPDIDPKLEESILDEIDNLFEKKLDEPPIKKNMDCDSEIKDASPVAKQELNMDDISDIRATISEILKVDEDNFNSMSDEHENKTNEKINDDKANEESTDIIKNIDAVLEDEKNVNEGTNIVDGGVAKDTIEKNEATEENKTNAMDLDQQLVDKKVSDDKITEAETNAEAVAETNAETTNATTNNSNETELSEVNTAVQEVNNSEAASEKEQEKNEFEKCIETNSKIDTPNNELNKSESKNNDATLQIDSCEEAMEVDSKAEEGTNDGNPVEVVDVSNENPPKDDIVCEDSNKCSAPNITDNLIEDQKSSNKDIEKQSQESTAEHGEPGDATAADSGNLQSNVEPEKCENSNDSSKSQNLECEDLLDISIIRDADEDNASAIEENANDAHTSEKSDNDNDDQDEGSDKAENDLDESEMDQDDTLLANDKEDNMDFEDGSSNLLCDQDNAIDENISDSENKNSETRDSENDSSNSVSKQKSDINDIELSSEKNGTEEISNNTETEGNEDSTEENSTKPSTKRSLSETDIAEIPNKKIKLTERSKTEDKISFRKNDKIKTLINFEKYMQNKKLENKLTRSDLEQFCLQKICEAIMHKTDVGELHQTIKKQEQIIENLRKDLQQLTKQTRDLDIVNKKLMNELRAQNGPKKPLVPLKITRSVGLQVKLNSSTETNNRRKVPIPTTPRTPTANNTAARPRTITPANAPVVRQVAASPRKAPTSAPLLSQALQNRSVTPVNNVAKRTPVRSKAAEPQRPANASVIDLTDEDDRASKGVGNSVKILNKTIPLSQGKTINIIPAKTVPNKMLNSNQNKTVAVGQVKTNVGAKVGTPTRSVTALPQGVRLTPTQVKNGSITIPASVVTSSSGTTQFMYVVQPGSVVTSTAGGTQKAVLLNFQPTNGVLTSTINGSAVSVLPSKTSNTVQLKTVTAPRKHPAPLPSPPPITINASLKPLLPKPHLSIRKTDTGIILQWRMPYNLDVYEAIASYQLFAYQETNAPPSTEMWRKVGDVKALALPMACTLTQFADKNKYYFAVRSIDVHKRIGAFSDPEEISL